MELSKRPWSNSSIDRLGRALADGSPDVPANSPSAQELIRWHSRFTKQVLDQVASLPWRELAQGRSYLLTSRTKTLDTLVQKLQRPGTERMLLSRMQDISGVRLDADVSLDEQDAAAEAIVDCFEKAGGKAKVKDLREGKHQGYRAVHVLIRLPKDGAPAEIQLRTALQGAWANLYERLGDHFGRDIRYEARTGYVDPLIESYAAELRQLSVGGITSLEQALRDEMRSRSGEEPIERYATMGVELAESDARQFFADLEGLRRRLGGGAAEGARVIHGMLSVLQERLEAAARRGKPGRHER